MGDGVLRIGGGGRNGTRRPTFGRLSHLFSGFWTMRHSLPVWESGGSLCSSISYGLQWNMATIVLMTSVTLLGYFALAFRCRCKSCACRSELSGRRSHGMGLRMAEPHFRLQCGESPVGAVIEREWLAAYTKAQHEPSVARQLEAKQVVCLLPTYLKHNPRFVWHMCRQMTGWRANARHAV